MAPKPPISFPQRIPLTSPSRNLCPITLLSTHTHRRHASTDPHTLPTRWLSDLKKRVGKCIIFGLSNQQIDEAGEIMRTVARDWRDLVAGSEGFLTVSGRAGFEGREVVWGEMDAMVSSLFDSGCLVDYFLLGLLLIYVTRIEKCVLWFRTSRGARASIIGHVRSAMSAYD